MSVSFKGDFKKLEQWAERAEEVPKLMPVISKNLAEESVSLVQAGMAKGIDPYGKSYEPLVLRSGQPLRKSGGMKSSWFRKHSNRGSFKISNAKKYSAFHQRGTGIYGPRGEPIRPKKAKALRIPTGGGAIFARSVKGTPKRLMVPDGRGLPRKWREAYQETVNEIFLSHFRSR